MEGIDKTKPIPLYYQIKEAIVERIRNGGLQPGDKLPTEAWFSEHFDVSRVTVRKALEELINDGVISRERGKGPVVAYPKISRRFNHLSGLYSELEQQNLTHTSRILLLEERKATSAEAAALGLETGSRVLFMLRLRLVEGRPLALQNVWLNKAYCEGLDFKLVETGSLYKQFERIGVPVAEATQTISAHRPTAEECRLLGLDADSPVLFMQRTTKLQNGDAIEYAETSYVAYKYNISMTLYP